MAMSKMRSVLLAATLATVPQCIAFADNPSTSSTVCAAPAEVGCTTKSTLDAFAKLIGPLNEFNEADWNRLRTCIEDNATPGANMVEFSDAAYAGFIAYGESNGMEDDRWFENEQWAEIDPTPLPDNNVLIVAPCNTNSNFAYYSSGIAVCDIDSWTFDEEVLTNMVQAFTVLAWGSAFFHASLTTLGGRADVLMNALMPLTVYQAMVDSYQDDDVIYKLQALDPAEEPIDSAIAGTQEMIGIVLGQSNPDLWFGPVSDLYFRTPALTSGFGAIITVILLAVVGPKLAPMIGELVAGAFLEEGEASYVLDELLPRLEERMEDVNPPLIIRIDFLRKAIGVLTKLLYAFLWQEEFVTLDIVFKESVNKLGGQLMGKINAIGNAFTGYDRKDSPRIQKAVDVYPGDIECRTAGIPHAKWHEQSANALIDLFLYCDEVKQVIEGAKKPKSNAPEPTDALSELAQCMDANQCLADDVDFQEAMGELGAAVSQCMGILRIGNEPNMVPYIGSFLTCIINVEAVQGGGGASGNQQETATPLDSCLLENSCIRLTNDFGLNGDKILECVGSRNIRRNENGREEAAPCNSLVDQHVRFSSCVQGCENDSFCLMDCMQDYGTTLSPGFESTMGCLQAMWLDDENSHQVCLGSAAPSDSMILKALRGLVSCEQCRNPRRRLMRRLSKTKRCTNSCVNDDARWANRDVDNFVSHFFGGKVENKATVLPLFCSLECFAVEA